MKKLMCVAVLALGWTTAVWADDESALVKLDAAQAAYDARGTAPEALGGAVEQLKLAAQEAEDDLLKFQVLILASRTVFYQGTLATTDKEKIPLFEAGMDYATKAKAVASNYAEGYYYYSVNMSRWAIAKGILNVLFKKDELIQNLKTTMEKQTMDGKDGAAIDYYGPQRVLGRVYFKLPGIAGGDNAKAEDLGSVAYQKAPEHPLNGVYYAHVLAKRGQKDKAREILTAIRAKTAEQFAADRIPESKMELSGDEMKEAWDAVN